MDKARWLPMWIFEAIAYVSLAMVIMVVIIEANE